MKKINYLDLFSGCGGLSYHFLKDKRFNLISSADNDLACHNTYLELCNSLGIKNSQDKVLKLDLNKKSALFFNFIINSIPLDESTLDLLTKMLTMNPDHRISAD